MFEMGKIVHTHTLSYIHTNIYKCLETDTPKFTSSARKYRRQTL